MCIASCQMPVHEKCTFLCDFGHHQVHITAAPHHAGSAIIQFANSNRDSQRIFAELLEARNEEVHQFISR